MSQRIRESLLALLPIVLVFIIDARRWV